MPDSFKIEGLDGVMKKLRALGGPLAKKAATAALRKGARIVVKAARANYAALGADDPATKSNIGKAIASRADNKLGQRNEGVAVKVGVVGGARPKKGTDDEGHWRFVEFGKEGVAARPFMRPALADNVEAVTQEVANQMNLQIDKVASKP